jgi:hypothetical protein
MVLVFIILAACLFAATLTAVSFLIPFQGVEEEVVPQQVEAPEIAPAQFFLEQVAATGLETPRPLQSVLSQLELHLRQEQAAAEAFLQGPSAESLHAPVNPSPWN